MGFIRKILASPLMFVAGIAVVLAAICSVLVYSLADSTTPKKWLAKSGVYDQALDVAADMLVARLQNSTDEQGQPMNLKPDDLLHGLADEAAVRAQLKTVLPPDFLRAQAESNLDNVYAYLSGKSPTLKLSLDIASREQDIRTALGNLFKSKLASLPICPGAGSLENFNLFSAKCLPASISLPAANHMIDVGVAKLKPLDATGLGDKFSVEFTSDKLTPVQRAFSFAREGMKLLLALTTLILLMLFWLWPEQDRKLAVVGKILLSAALTIAISSIVGKILGSTSTETLLKTQLPQQAQAATHVISQILSTINDDLSIRMLVLAFIMVASGAGLMFTSRFVLAQKTARVASVLLLLGVIYFGYTAAGFFLHLGINNPAL